MSTEKSGTRIQEWLTPALLGAGLMVLIFIATQQITLGEKVGNALLKIERLQTVLEQRGFIGPMPKNGEER